MKAEEFVDQLRPYEDRWVALREPEREVVGSGADASEALRDAKDKGYEDVVLLKVPRFDRGYVFPA